MTIYCNIKAECFLCFLLLSFIIHIFSLWKCKLFYPLIQNSQMLILLQALCLARNVVTYRPQQHSRTLMMLIKCGFDQSNSNFIPLSFISNIDPNSHFIFKILSILTVLFIWTFLFLFSLLRYYTIC